jgi:hypothetical protein
MSQRTANTKISKRNRLFVLGFWCRSARKKNIGRLDISMQNLPGVHVGDGTAELFEPA